MQRKMVELTLMLLILMSPREMRSFDMLRRRILEARCPTAIDQMRSRASVRSGGIAHKLSVQGRSGRMRTKIRSPDRQFCLSGHATILQQLVRAGVHPRQRPVLLHHVIAVGHEVRRHQRRFAQDWVSCRKWGQRWWRRRRCHSKSSFEKPFPTVHLSRRDSVCSLLQMS
jgi:hypothetical protein